LVEPGAVYRGRGTTHAQDSGGSRSRWRGAAVTLDDTGFDHAVSIGQIEEILAVDEVLERLAQLDAQQARIVELRYFGGLSVKETAEAAGISPRTVKRD